MIRVTAVWECSSPLKEAASPRDTAVFARRTPSMCADAPSVTAPATAQNTLFALAPPWSSTLTFAAKSNVPAICRTQTSAGPPERVRSMVTVTAVFQAWTPGGSVRPPMAPAPASTAEVGVRPLA